MAVAGGDAADTEVLLLVAEAALHDGGAQVTDDTAGGRDVGLLVLGLGTFADEVGRDATLGAILPVFVVGIDGVCNDFGDFCTSRFLLIPNALLYHHVLVECFRRNGVP